MAVDGPQCNGAKSACGAWWEAGVLSPEDHQVRSASSQILVPLLLRIRSTRVLGAMASWPVVAVQHGRCSSEMPSTLRPCPVIRQCC